VIRKILFALLSSASLSLGHAAQKSQALKVPSVDGVPIAYEVFGQGDPALVLVHGWSCDRSYWNEQIEYLGAQYRLVLVDLAGHGDSGSSRKEYTMTAFGADVAAVVEQLGLQRIVLVGHSMGGDVIVDAARLLPGRVAGLVWVDDYKSLGAASSDAQIDAFVTKFRRDFRGTTISFVRGMFGPDADPALVERVARDMASAPPAIALSAMRNSFGNARHVPAALAALKLPVIAINSDREPTDHESLARHGVKAFVLPDSGHFPMLEDPARFNRTLDSMVKGMVR
jgi:pimeloyl-ACP methyl ester carboxylesterase